MASDREGRGPLLLRSIERGKKTGIDLAPALAAINQAIAQRDKQKRSHHTQRPALVAMVAAQPRPDTAHLAPKEQPAAPAPGRIEAPTSRSSAASSIDRAAAPALPEACSAALVAFLDAQHIRQQKNLPALVAFIEARRAGLDDTALLVAVQRAKSQAEADIARRGQAVTSPFGLFKFKIGESIGQAQEAAAAEAQCAAEQERQEASMLASMLAGLNENGQRFYAVGSAHDWPTFRYLRLWDGWKDWLIFASHYGEDTNALYAALASINLAEEAAPARIEAAAAPTQELRSAAPSMERPDQGEQPDQAGPIEAPTSSPDQPAAATTEAAPARIHVLRPPRFWQLACALNYPHVELIADDLDSEIVLDGLESWQAFREKSSASEQRKAEKYLGKMERGLIASAGTRPPGRYRLGERPIIEATTSSPDQPAAQGRKLVAPLLDRAIKLAKDNAALL